MFDISGFWLDSVDMFSLYIGRIETMFISNLPGGLGIGQSSVIGKAGRQAKRPASTGDPSGSVTH